MSERYTGVEAQIIVIGSLFVGIPPLTMYGVYMLIFLSFSALLLKEKVSQVPLADLFFYAVVLRKILSFRQQHEFVVINLLALTHCK